MSRTDAPDAIAAELDELLTEEDELQLAGAGITRAELVRQIARFRRGCPPLRLDRPCRIGDGIRVLSGADGERLQQRYGEAIAAGRVTHFVPASGAASRMFQSLFAVYERHAVIDDGCLERMRREPNAAERDFLRFLDGMPDLALTDELRECMRADRLCLDRILAGGDRRLILGYLLTAAGLDYGDRPKGLIPFHHYAEENRTPFEEHLAEADDGAGRSRARVHFTVSPQYRHLVERHLQREMGRAAPSAPSPELGLSVQDTATDTVAVDARNRPLRDAEGRLVLRPGGHGALLGNLAQLGGDLVFIKNIDNIMPADRRAVTRSAKQLLGGCLIELQEQVFAHLRRLLAGPAEEAVLEEIARFVERQLGLRPLTSGAEHGGGERGRADRQRDLIRLLDRPVRVCGMVRNAGEPGGGPFWVVDANGRRSVQIVESSQVDPESPGQQRIFRDATHFNPVFLFCGLRDHQGRSIDVERYVDEQAGFISTKSKGGAVLKVLELPGLWNGAMADWSTMFVEVPAEIFSPVKTVLDLLRPEHRPAAA